MKVIAIVQARMGSKRFPGKIMEKINGIPAIDILLLRLKKSKKIDKIIVATSKNKENKSLQDHFKKKDQDFFAGSENDVLDRFYKIAQKENPKTIIRITGDCPLIDSTLVDKCVDLFYKSKVDYVSNILPPTYPDGLDVEVFNFSSLKKAWENAKSKSDREHVTSYILKNKSFKKNYLLNKEDNSNIRVTLDYKEDLKVIKKIFNHFYPRVDFKFSEIITFLKKNKEIMNINKKYKRNETINLNSGQKLLSRAKEVIPGTNMLLSKRSDMFLPKYWPSYYKKAKGCTVWDLDNKKYIDMSLMGVGTNILGYSHPKVNEEVIKNVKNSNMSTLNCPEEVELAEKLLEMHPWAHMAKFARTGGEANSIAIRIARASTGKDKIAVCGYHGWHDWYLSANISNNNNLSGHLLEGLNPKGVPKALKNTVFPFRYNDLKGLKKIIEEQNIGAIKMEVFRTINPENNFLQSVRDLATKNKIILIFDECTSGFRENFGGLHMKYKIYPDMAIFGKALGNGFAITSVIGKKDLMIEAESTFISSTFWTERAGPTAALKTLEVMEETKSWEIITNQGIKIKKGWERLSKKYEIKTEQSGLPSLSNFSFSSKNAKRYKAFLTYKMLEEGFLASNVIYTCIDHTDEVIKSYFDSLEKVFIELADFEKGRNLNKLNDIPIPSNGFERLN